MKSNLRTPPAIQGQGAQQTPWAERSAPGVFSEDIARRMPPLAGMDVKACIIELPCPDILLCCLFYRLSSITEACRQQQRQGEKKIVSH